MNTRKATLDDLDKIIKLFDQYRVFYEQESDLQSAEAFLSERIMNGESVIFLAEDHDNRFVGFTQLYPIFSSVRMKKAWLLNDLFVHPDFRGSGISKRLIECAKNLCRETDACELMLETQKNNYPANQLYLKTGFVLNSHNFYFWTE